MNKLLTLAAASFFIGCKTDPIVKPLPRIEINTPSSNQHFVLGDTIHITGTITHTLPLTEVGVHMTDLSSKIEFFHNHYSGGNTTSFNFDVKYALPNNVKTSFELEVEATDKDLNTATEEIMLLIN